MPCNLHLQLASRMADAAVKHTSAWSRQSRSFHGFPVRGWRSGALHFPVLAEVPCLWKPWARSSTQYNSSQASRHFRSAKCQPRTLAGFVQAWKHVTQFRKWHKHCMQRGRMARKERLLRTLHEVQLAAEKHDHWRLYQIVRRLAPKQWSSKLQLKVAGRLLSVLEEMSVIHQHFQDLFNPAECLAPSVRSLATAKHVDRRYEGANKGKFGWYWEVSN